MKLGIEQLARVVLRRTGKALAQRRRTEITIQFKQAPLTLFRDTPSTACRPTT